MGVESPPASPAPKVHPIVNPLVALPADGALPGLRASQPALREHVAMAVRRYLSDLGEHVPQDLYEVVLAEVEAPLLAETLRHYQGNQSRAAAALGLNRATLRKKLRQYGLA